MALCFPAMRSPNIRYLPGVDHLRGAAALLIVIYHGVHILSHRELYQAPFDPNPNKWLETYNILWSPIIEGHTAVALFMVLSGFIFTFGARGSEIGYWAFMRNRVLRIFPLYLLLLVVGIYVYPQNFSLGGLFQDVGFMANLPGIMQLDPFGAMFWAIAIEFQFYFVFPFLLLFSRRYGLKYLLGIIALFTLFRVGGYLLGADIVNLSYMTIVGRIDQFALGMLAGALYQADRPADRRALLAFVLSSLAAFLSLHGFHLLGGYPTEAFYKLFWPTFEGTFWALVIVTYLPVSRCVPRLLSRPLIWIGTVSFSIYLLHIVFLTILVEKGVYFSLSFHSAPLNALANSVAILVPLTLAGSALTYNLIEKPFLDLRRRYKIRPIPSTSGLEVPGLSSTTHREAQSLK